MGRLVGDASPHVCSLHAGILGCSHVYALMENKTVHLPIASFQLDKQSRTASLQHLLTQFALRADGRFGRTTSHQIYRYCVCIFRDHYEIDEIRIPGQLPTSEDHRMMVIFDGHQTIVRRYDSIAQ